MDVVAARSSSPPIKQFSNEFNVDMYNQGQVVIKLSKSYSPAFILTQSSEVKSGQRRQLSRDDCGELFCY